MQFARKRRRQPFINIISLIDILVVLLIMGLLASITVPNLQRLYNSVQHDAEREEALGASRITDWLSPEFFTRNFWFMWATTFAFQRWHSAVEFKR